MLDLKNVKVIIRWSWAATGIWSGSNRNVWMHRKQLDSPAGISLYQVLPEYNTSEPLLCVLPILNFELQIWNASHPQNVFVGSWMWLWISLSMDWIWVHMQPPEGWAVCTIYMGWPIILAQLIQDITQHIASTLTRANGMNIMTQGESCVVTKWCYYLFVLNYVQYCNWCAQVVELVKAGG